jgi:hypothetical protein
MAFPNGTVITPDGHTLIVGESYGGRLTAFDIDSDGALSNRRVWAQLPQGSVPDGICLDAAMGVRSRHQQRMNACGSKPAATSPIGVALIRVRSHACSAVATAARCTF